MGIFEHFPYSNFHNLNLDRILERTKKAEEDASAAAQAAETAAAAIAVVRDYPERAYVKLFDVDGYVIHNSAKVRAAATNTGFIIVGGEIVFWMGSMEALDSTSYTYIYHKMLDFDSSILEFLPDKFFSKGIAFMNGNLFEIVISYGQDPGYFQDGVWFRPAGGSAVSSGSSTPTKAFFADPIAIARLENVYTTP